MPYKLLISGSRVMGDERIRALMIAKLREVLTYAHSQRWHIVVGDASGIDCETIRLCVELGLPFTCHGITDSPRCLDPIDGVLPLAGVWNGETTELGEYIKCQLDAKAKRKYLKRDEVMCRIADRLYALCYKHSYGTTYTYTFMREVLKRPAQIRHFNENGMEEMPDGK